MAESSRSRAYPGISLPEAVEVLRRQVEGLGWGAHDRNAIAQALAYTSSSSGAAIRKLAALTYFGLLRKQGALYEPTDLAKVLLQAEDERDLQAARRKAFLSPALFREILEDYSASGKIPRLLPHSLRKYRIATNARDEVARNFIESGQYAQVMDASGNIEKAYLTSVGRSTPPAEPSPQAARSQVEDETPDETLAPKQVPAAQTFHIYLTDDKMAELKVPLRLNDQDLEILRKQLNVLETQVQVNRPAPPLRWASRQERGAKQD